MMIQTKALKLQQRDYKFYVTTLALKDIINHYKVDRIDIDENKGYQRPLDPRRVNAVRKYLTEKEGLFPNSILFNVRQGLQFEPSNGSYGVLTIKSDIWLVDGQHRIGGLEEAVKDDKSFSDYEIPCVILDGFDWHEELKHFYIVNTEQKGVPVDVAIRHLVEKEKKEGVESVLPQLEMVIGIQVADRLAMDTDSPLYGQIQLSDQPMKITGQIITEKSVMRSLLPVMRIKALVQEYKTNRNEGVKKITELLKRYWSATKDICPECFDNPKNYLLLKTTGMYVMHLLFPTIFDACARSNDLSKKYMLELLRNTEMSSESWTSSAAGQYGGMQGFLRYAHEFEKKLPPPKLNI